MCTVTFLPLRDNGFIMTSNRDESPKRGNAIFPSFRKVDNKHLLFPQDPDAGGTWMATTDNGTTVCLLNGAFQPHEHKPPYRMSRGLVVLEAVECIKPNEFVRNFDFEDIEPFTLVMLYHDPELKLLEFRWDGKNGHSIVKDPAYPHIWASAQLYNKQLQETKNSEFEKWVEAQKRFKIDPIRSFHKEPFNILTHPKVKTVSTTTVASDEQKVSMVYESLETVMTPMSITLSQEINLDLSHSIL